MGKTEEASRQHELVPKNQPKAASEEPTALTREILVDLLVPSVWGPALEQYARATHIAVQLFGFDGSIITECVNPQPLWTAMQRSGNGEAACAFSIANESCACVRDAFHGRKNVFVTGQTGLVHFAVPLFLQERAVGVLLAGQVFDQYPEMLSLDWAVRASGLSTENIWNIGCHSRPIPRATLIAYSELLTTLAMSILQARYRGILEAKRLQELEMLMETTQSALAEKEALLSEIHHRVKNNLQVISSLLGLKALQIEDERVVMMFEEMRQRVQSIGTIHESLYRSNSFAAIDFADNAQSLADTLLSFYGLAGRVQVELPKRGVALLPIDRAVTCNLLLNELVSNALKHAFPRGEGGRIRIEMCEDGGRYDLRVTDNGVGMPKGYEIGKSKSFGLRLAELLASQLGGTIDIKSDAGGTSVHVSFARKASQRGKL